MKNPSVPNEKEEMGRLEMVEGGEEKRPYPKGIFFIMATELSERFSYYGMRAVLTIYMRNILSFTEDEATSYYHIFLMICYGLPMFWGVISDSWLGKFKTILYVSVLFAIGNITLALSSIPPLHIPTTTFFFVGLILMAIGTAGMKPCVAPLGGEQFVMPDQTKQLSQFFSVFFFVVTIGNMISTVITPIFRRDVSCFGMENCYPLAFGVPAGIMVFAVVIFLCGKPMYNVNKPNGNMLVKVTKCVAHALSKRWRKNSDLVSRRHWLDSASDLYDQQIIADTKGLLRILPYFIPVPMFFALYEQLGSRWTLQATRMKGALGSSFSIKPDQMQVSNAILMFISLPLFNWAIYPLLSKFGINLRTLTRMVIGGILAAMSFGVAGLVELKIEPSTRSQPTGSDTLVSLVNSIPCPVSVTVMTNPPSGASHDYIVGADTVLTLPSLSFENPTFSVKPVDVQCSNADPWTGELNMLANQYQTVSISMLSNNSLSVMAYPFEDDFAKSKDGNARVRFIVEQKDFGRSFMKADMETVTIIMTPEKGEVESFDLVRNAQMDGLFNSETEEIVDNKFNVSIKTASGTTVKVLTRLELLNGGSYNLIFRKKFNEKLEASPLVIITPPNDVHILWLLPQYILMAWGEILFIVSGMEFAYTEAPASMKSVVQAIWHFMNACGNVIVIIAAQKHGKESQAVEFFIFAGCMFIDAIVYGFMARRYKYVVQTEKTVVMH